MADIFEFQKSTLPQEIYPSPYSDKQWGWINDINNGIYSQQSSIVTFDMTSIYNSSRLVNLQEAIIVVPVNIVSCYVSAAGALIAPVNSSWMSVAPKFNFGTMMVHSIDFQANNKSFSQPQPMTNMYSIQKLYQQMGVDDQQSMGSILGMGRGKMDNFASVRYNGPTNIGAQTGAFPATTPVAGGTAGTGTYTSYGGAGLCNNFVEPPTGAANQSDQAAATGTSIASRQFANTYNEAAYSRLCKYLDVSANQINNIFATSGGIITASNLGKEFQPTYSIQQVNYMCIQDFAIIRLKDICNAAEALPLMKAFSGVIRLTLNTGNVVSNLDATGNYLITSSTGINFGSGTCPILHTAGSGVPTATSPQSLVTGVFVGSVTATAISASGASINLANSQLSNAGGMSACRFYYPTMALKPELMIRYLEDNRQKKICYTGFFTSQLNAIASQNSFSFLANSSIKNLKAVWVIPLISGTVNGIANANGGTNTSPFQQFQSPYDTCPATTSPCTLTSLNVCVAGVNVLQNPISVAWEHLLFGLGACDSRINSNEMRGMSNSIMQGVHNWRYSTVYYIDCSRGLNSDLLTPRNVVISGFNNSNLPIDLWVFTEYTGCSIVDVEKGTISDWIPGM